MFSRYVGKIPWRMERLPTPIFCLGELHGFIYRWGFPDSSVGKESICNAVDPGLIPGLGGSAGEGIGFSLQYS